MNILHTVEFYSPSVGGAQEVVKQISERLVRRGHQVTVATTHLPKRNSLEINGVKIIPFAISGNQARGFQGETQRYKEFLLNSKFDVMMNYAAQQWTADLAFPVLDRLKYPAVLAPCGFSGLKDIAYQDYFRQLPEILNKYSSLILHSTTYQDARFITEAGIRKIKVIPNGASEEEFKPGISKFRRNYKIADDEPLFLTVGSHTHLKGHRMTLEAFWFSRLRKATFIIIGNRPFGHWGCLPECTVIATGINIFSRGKKRVLLLNLQRQDVVDAYQAADIFLLGSNIEYSPLVLFEAMASHTPFISLACGNAAEIAEWSGSGEILPSKYDEYGLIYGDPHRMAISMDTLFDDREKRIVYGEAGYKAFTSRFNWEKIVTEYEQLYVDVSKSFMGLL